MSNDNGPVSPESLTGQNLSSYTVGVTDVELEEYLERNDTPTIEAIVEFHKLREENANLCKSLWSVIDDEHARKILASVYHSNGRGVRYDALMERLRCSRKTAQRRVRELEQENILTRLGKPTLVRYETSEARLLAGDTLNVVYNV